MSTAQLTCFRCGKPISVTFHRKDRRAYCSAECKRETYRQEKKVPPKERICRYCLKPFFTGNRGQIKYCSRECLNRARHMAGAEGVVPVGKVFVRSDDKHPVMVSIDTQGLPCVNPLAEVYL